MRWEGPLTAANGITTKGPAVGEYGGGTTLLSCRLPRWICCQVLCLRWSVIRQVPKCNRLCSCSSKCQCYYHHKPKVFRCQPCVYMCRGGTPVSFRLVRTCVQNGMTYSVLTQSNSQGPPSSAECRCPNSQGPQLQVLQVRCHAPYSNFCSSRTVHACSLQLTPSAAFLLQS